MATSSTSQSTDFTKDVLGRYMCNGLDEAMHSADKNAQRPDGSPQTDARPFNAIIIGGGSFGGVLAQHLLYADETNSYRILVLEAGRHSLPEHFQNLPALGLGAPGPTSVDPGVPRAEVWGLPWRTNVAAGFPGLAYTIGGRSLFFGGWSPRLLDEEMPPAKWPPNVVAQLKQKYFDEAARQIGTDSANDFIQGELHSALRKILAAGITGQQGPPRDPAQPVAAAPERGRRKSACAPQARSATGGARQAAASRVLPDQQVQLGPAADGGGARGADALRRRRRQEAADGGA